MNITTSEPTTPCLGCNTPISLEAAHWCDGRCYQCQCDAHATGEIDMDYSENIPAFRPDEDHYDDGMTEEDAAVAEGIAEYIENSPSIQFNRERERLAAGVFVSLTVGGDLSWEIPF